MDIDKRGGGAWFLSGALAGDAGTRLSAWASYRTSGSTSLQGQHRNAGPHAPREHATEYAPDKSQSQSYRDLPAAYPPQE
eukprot:363045-Chlamydomonas_euryale.AAC.3